MDIAADIPSPILFNPFKHHLNCLVEILNHASPEVFSGLPDPLCNNYIDIYTGTMTPAAIGSAVIAFLQSNHILQKEKFIRWITAGKGYRKIALDDHSEWIIRVSENPDRYIHIHPARSGPFTIRFKGSTLKTVYLLKTGFGGQVEMLSTELINRARKQINLSPISSLDRCKGIMHCYRTFPASQVYTGGFSFQPDLVRIVFTI